MIKNIGTLKGRLLVFGGPYSNLQATEAVLEKAKALEIPSTHIICTGDVTAYCGQPEETSRLIHDSGIHVIQGNCDESLANDSEDCACGFDENTACEVFADRWYNFSRQETSAEMKKWMGTLPFRIEFDFAGKKFHVLHGSNDQINEFVFASASTDYLMDQISKTGADIVIGGHNGMHFTSVIGDKVWHNAGVVGMPANDGTPRTWYSIIEEKEGQIYFSHHTLDYDYAVAAQIMNDAGLKEYAQTITTGLWPSLDVLPEEEKQKTGVALQSRSTKH